VLFTRLKLPALPRAAPRRHATLSVCTYPYWDEWLPFACFTYNTTPHSVTKYTPYEVLFGRIANIPGKLQRQPQPLYNFDDIVMDIRQKIQNCQQVAREKLIKFKELQTQNVKSNGYDFKENDLVLLKIRE
jgi:hypothetical protein